MLLIYAMNLGMLGATPTGATNFPNPFAATVTPAVNPFAATVAYKQVPAS